ncbi:hypothetical protein [Pleomorphovibrio marinus]|uniref:hypothetical protein n=1 Tax=Pleomorphovibrio marinus TaxID=2164132 RepID=UPI000E0B3C96|nr:hypothetical protein [Pleomorphovibrio marinus]
MKTKITNLFLCGILLLFFLFGCVENELLETDQPGDVSESELDIDFITEEWSSNFTRPTFEGLKFQEPNYDSLFNVNLSMESVKEFVSGSGNEVANENAWTLLKQKIESSTPEIKSFFENADANTLKNIINPSYKLEESFENFFADLFNDESLGLSLPSQQNPYKRQEMRKKPNKEDILGNSNLRRLDLMENNFPNTCVEDVYYLSGGFRRALNVLLEQEVSEIEIHYSNEWVNAEERYLERGDLIDLLYQERVALVSALIEQGLALAAQSGFTNTEGLRIQIYQLGVVYAYFIRTQMEVWYEAGKELNELLFDRETQIILAEMQLRIEEVEKEIGVRWELVTDWEKARLEECATKGTFTSSRPY